MAGRLRSLWRFVSTLGVMNLRGAAEYRVSFLAQALFMAVNDAMFVVFWVVFFHRFPVLRGWRLPDLMVLFGMAAFSFGLATLFTSNVRRLSGLVAKGGLDPFLAMPRDPLLHLMLTRMSPPAAGDLAFGLLVFLGFADDPWAALPAFVLTGLLSAVIFVAFGVVTGSLAFWSGSSEGLARLMNDAVLVFSSYPDSVFGGWTRLLLYTALPAAFVTHVPVHVVRTGSPLWLLALAAAALAWAAGAVGVFRAGLRRYESGNLIVGLNEG